MYKYQKSDHIISFILYNQGTISGTNPPLCLHKTSCDWSQPAATKGLIGATDWQLPWPQNGPNTGIGGKGMPFQEWLLTALLLANGRFSHIFLVREGCTGWNP